MAALRAFAVTVGALLVVAVIADAAVTTVAERQASDRVSAALQAPARVQFSGWPVTVGLLRGRVAAATVTATTVPLETAPVTLASLRAELRDVRIDFGALRRPEVNVPVGGGSFVAEMDEAAVAGLLAETLALAEVAVSLERGRVTVTTPEGTFTATVAVDGGTLLLQPVGTQGNGPHGAIPLALGRLPGGVALTGAAVTDGALELSGPITALTIRQ